MITFGQPLFQKATNIISSCTDSDPLRKIVLRLDAFHTEMSFLGSIGQIMSGSGLQEAIETVYAPNAVTYMMNGKSVARALRGHFLVDTALHAILLSSLQTLTCPHLKKDLICTKGKQRTNSTTKRYLHGQLSELYEKLTKKTKKRDQ